MERNDKKVWKEKFKKCKERNVERNDEKEKLKVWKEMLNMCKGKNVEKSGTKS